MNDLVILSLLLGGRKHGYMLKREAGLILGQTNLHSNIVYPLLRRFVSQGLIRQTTGPGERGQTRKLYSLTPLGRRTLIERISDFNEQDARSVEAFQLRVGMFSLIAPELRERILSVRAAALQAQEQRLAALQKGMELGFYGGEVVQHRREWVQSELAWVHRLERIHKNPKGSSK